jgi:hypothetical protein
VTKKNNIKVLLEHRTMGNKHSSTQDRAKFYDEDLDDEDGSRHVRFQVEVIPQDRESRIFRSFRTGPFKRTSAEKRRSTTYDSANKTPWPHPQSDSLFLPEYEYKSAVKFNEYQVYHTYVTLTINNSV